jgi:hypothetical protein
VKDFWKAILLELEKSNFCVILDKKLTNANVIRGGKNGCFNPSKDSGSSKG